MLRWIRRRFWKLINGFVALALAVGGVLVALYPEPSVAWAKSASGIIILVLIVGLGIAATVRTIADEPAIGDLQDKLRQKDDIIELRTIERDAVRADLRESCEVNLKHLGNTLNFGKDERITVYYVTEQGYQNIGRFSLNSEYRKIGRPTLPLHEGAIGRAHAGEDVFLDKLPDPEHESEHYLSEVHRLFDVPIFVASEFRMKARTLAARWILDPLEDYCIAVIAFESIRAQAFTSDAVTGALEAEKNRLSHYLQIIRPPTSSTTGFETL